MRLVLVSLALSSALSSAVMLCAQSAGPSFVPPTTVQILSPPGMNCPVGLTAERQASGQREWVVSLGASGNDAVDSVLIQRLRSVGAGVHVELFGTKLKPIRQAELVVSYLAPGRRVLLADQAQTNGFPRMERTKTFVLSASNSDSDKTFAGSLLVGPTAGILRVNLTSITYADGSTWQPSNGSKCTVEPSLLMNVMNVNAR